MERDFYYLTPEKALEHAKNGNLSTADAADRCDVKVRTFRRWLRASRSASQGGQYHVIIQNRREAQIARTIEFYFFQGYSLSRSNSRWPHLRLGLEDRNKLPLADAASFHSNVAFRACLASPSQWTRISDDRKADSTAENAESLFQEIELILRVHKLVISDIYAVDEVQGRLVGQLKLKKVVPKGAQHPRLRGDLLAKWTKTPVRMWHVWAEMERWFLRLVSSSDSSHFERWKPPTKFLWVPWRKILLTPQANGKMETECSLRWMKHFHQPLGGDSRKRSVLLFWIKCLVTCLMKSWYLRWITTCLTSSSCLVIPLAHGWWLILVLISRLTVHTTIWSRSTKWLSELRPVKSTFIFQEYSIPSVTSGCEQTKPAYYDAYGSSAKKAFEQLGLFPPNLEKLKGQIEKKYNHLPQTQQKKNDIMVFRTEKASQLCRKLFRTQDDFKRSKRLMYNLYAMIELVSFRLLHSFGRRKCPGLNGCKKSWPLQQRIGYSAKQFRHRMYEGDYGTKRWAGLRREQKQEKRFA